MSVLNIFNKLKSKKKFNIEKPAEKSNVIVHKTTKNVGLFTKIREGLAADIRETPKHTCPAYE